MIHDNLKQTDFFYNPTDKSKWTEELAPGTVNEKCGDLDKTYEYPSANADCHRFINLERINRIDQIRPPGKSRRGKYQKKSDPNRIGPYKRRAVLPHDSSRISMVSIQTEDQVLKRSHLASPGTDEFICEKNHKKENRRGDHPWRENQSFGSVQSDRILDRTHRPGIRSQNNSKDNDGC
jgi:hypothetical protein